MPGRFLEIPVFLGDYFIMPHPVHFGINDLFTNFRIYKLNKRIYYAYFIKVAYR